MDFSVFVYQDQDTPILKKNPKRSSSFETIDLITPSEEELAQFDSESLIPTSPCNSSILHDLVKDRTVSNQDTKASPNKLIKRDHGQISRSIGLEDLFKSPSQDLERPLRLLLIGHNPSYHSWTLQHYYANPVNRMWSLLCKARIVPPYYTCKNDIDCPKVVGVGFSDLVSGVCETESKKISNADCFAARLSLYDRILKHCDRVRGDCNLPINECYPRIIAFTGVKQFKALFPSGAVTDSKKRKLNPGIQAYFEKPNDMNSVKEDRMETIDLCKDASTSSNTSNTTLEYGIQKTLPPDWPHLLSKSVVVLLPSSSGAAAMTNSERETPYMDLGVLLSKVKYRKSDDTTERNDILPCWQE